MTAVLDDGIIQEGPFSPGAPTTFTVSAASSAGRGLLQRPLDSARYARKGS